LTGRVNALSGDIDFWNRFTLWGLGIAAVAAVWIGVATRMVIFQSKRLALAQSQLDSAKERELQSQVATADSKRIDLQTRILDIFGPRQLTPEQSAQALKGLAGLKGEKVDVYVFKLGIPYNRTDFSNDSNLGIAFVHTLRLAGLDAEGWVLESCQEPSAASNLVVGVIGNDPNDKRTAGQILKALPTEIGVWPEIEDNFFPVTCAKFSSLDPSTPNKRPYDAKISIAIGKKIQPILTREMLEPADEGKKR
jgi:hypothetical protein